jgi:hypothetical protein
MKIALALVLSYFLLAASPVLGAENDTEGTPRTEQSEESNLLNDEQEVMDVFDVGEQKLKEQELKKREQPEEPIAEEMPKKKEATPPLRVGGAVTVGLGAAALIAGAVTGGFALNIDKSLDSTKCPDGQCYQEYSDDVDRRDSLALSTNILLISGSAAAIGGVLMVVFSYPEFQPWAKKSQKTEAISVRPIIGRSFVGAAFAWSF